MNTEQPIIGIDLGTTNSLACVWRDGKAEFIHNALGDILTPSVVGIDDDGQIICGRPALERLYTHPHLTASIFKRYMGSNKTMQLGNQSFKSEELSAMVLKSIKADAEAMLGHEIVEAIITVPAYFNDTQRKITKVAGELAGLTVERLLNEPTAAALAYGLHEKDEAQFLVFDLGGGTFDVSVLELFDGVMEVRASAGNNQLGGEDFTKLIMDDFVTSMADLSEEQKKTAHTLEHRIVAEAERAKLALSSANEYEMSVNFNDFSHANEISRAHFESLAAPLLKKIQMPVKQALHDSSIKPNELDAVILVGGATRMSMIPKLVTSMFGRFPERDLDPDTVVGIGAAVQAALKQRDEAVKDVVLTDICPYTLGIEVTTDLPDGRSRSGVFSPIIERNTIVPVSREERYITAEDDQNFINAKVYQGESRYTSDNIFLGNLEIPVKEAPAGHQAVDIRFSYDVNGLLEVDATVVNSGESTSTVITNKDTQLSKEEIAESLEKLKGLKIHPRENTENLAAIYKGNRLYEQNLGKSREQIGQLLDQFINVLESQDDNEIKKARERFSDMIADYEL